jgi:hypothetical protein
LLALRPFALLRELPEVRDERDVERRREGEVFVGMAP